MNGRTQGGFTLIELLVVLTVAGLLAVFGANIAIGVLEAGRTTETRSRLDAVEQALALFVAQNGRLPCPANGTIAVLGANEGVAQPTGPGACTVAAMTAGVVPWATLGLSQSESLDAWSRRFSYRVFDNAATGLTRTNGLALSQCDPAGTAVANVADCAAASPRNTPAQFAANKGLTVRTAPGGTLLNDPADLVNTPGGAAYVLISHGENGRGAYTPSGALQASIGATSVDEAPNANNTVLNGAVPTGTDGFIDRPYDQSTVFDDLVRRPTILAVAATANRGPRSHADP